MPGVRPHLWEGVYNSIKESTTRSFELIIISPYALPQQLQNCTNIKYIKDYGSPVRCHGIGLSLAEGKYMGYAVDDGLFLPGIVDGLLNDFESMGPDKKNVLSPTYTEAGNHFPESYFLVNGSIWTSSPHVPNNWYILNFPIIRTEFFRELGGLDIQFEGLAMAATDLAIRAYRNGANVKFTPVEYMHLDFEGPLGGTHAPIHHSQTEHDGPLFKQIHNDPESVNRICLPTNTWKNSPAVWTRRFGDI